jgi:hypothetical protein
MSSPDLNVDLASSEDAHSIRHPPWVSLKPAQYGVRAGIQNSFFHGFHILSANVRNYLRDTVITHIRVPCTDCQFISWRYTHKMFPTALDHRGPDLRR